ncbi:MAG: tetratricopeptide repeat protein [Treponema sp.]|nr:tetratricopeptide repeat protein [Treponema sp.]
MNATNETKKKFDDRKKKAAVVALIAVLLFSAGIAGGRLLVSGGGSSKGKAKNNTVSLVNLYYEKGEYDRALDKLESLLLENPNDPEALALMEKILKAKEMSASGRDSGMGGGNSSVNVTVDTDGLQAAMESSINSMKNELEKNNAKLNEQIAKNNAEAEKNRKAMAELLKKQQEQAAAEKARQEQLIAEQKAAEAERKKAEEVRKKQEAERKAAEEALMKKNAAIKKEISGVNDEIQQAKAALNAGNIDSAVSHFNKAESLLPVAGGDPEYEPAFSASKNTEMASLLYEASLKASSPEEKKRLEELAVEYAKKAVAADGKSSASQYILGMDEYSKKNYAKALEYLTKAVENNNSNSLYYYNLGRVQFQMKKFTEARYSFSTSCQLDPAYAPARYNLGITNNRLNDPKAALSDFRKVHDIDSHHENSYLEEARILMRLNDNAGAIAAYKNVIKLNSTNRNALNELGTAYSSAKKYSDAESTFRQSLAMLPAGKSDPLTYYNLSTVLFEQNKTEDALVYAKKAYESSAEIKDKSSRANIMYNYALLCDKSGNTDKAISVYAEVLGVNPSHLKTQINLGVMYMNMTPPDADTALSLFLKAYAQDKNNFEVNNNLGSAYLSKEAYSDAIKYFQNALRLDPKNNAVRFNLAQAFASDSQFDNAETTYKELLKQDSENWDGYIELAKVCMAKGNNAAASKYLEFVKIKKPGYRTGEIDSLIASMKI